MKIFFQILGLVLWLVSCNHRSTSTLEGRDETKTHFVGKDCSATPRKIDLSNPFRLSTQNAVIMAEFSRDVYFGGKVSLPLRNLEDVAKDYGFTYAKIYELPGEADYALLIGPHAIVIVFRGTEITAGDWGVNIDDDLDAFT